MLPSGDPRRIRLNRKRAGLRWGLIGGEYGASAKTDRDRSVAVCGWSLVYGGRMCLPPNVLGEATPGNLLSAAAVAAAGECSTAIQRPMAAGQWCIAYQRAGAGGQRSDAVGECSDAAGQHGAPVGTAASRSVLPLPSAASQRPRGSPATPHPSRPGAASRKKTSTSRSLRHVRTASVGGGRYQWSWKRPGAGLLL